MNTMSFYEFRSEQTASGSRSYIFKENKIISQTYPHIKTNQGLTEYTKKTNKKVLRTLSVHKPLFSEC